MAEAVIDTHGLRRTFGSGKKSVEAVAGIDLRVEEGEIFGFLGPNGAGKTTTLRMLATLLPPSAGEASVAGCDLRREPGKVRERIGYVGQEGGAEPLMTGRQELVFQARVYRMSASEARARAADLLHTLDLAAFADRKVQTYSGGQRRRLEIGLGIIHRPRLVFLDEPSSGLDPQSRARLWDEVLKLRASGTTVFVTTHYLEEADALCDRLAIIDQGRIAAIGTPDELKREISGDVVTIGVADTERALRLLESDPLVREVELGQDVIRLYVDRGEQAMPALLRTLDRAEVGLQTIALHRPSLDDVFLRKTGRSLRETAA
jgi:ABC-2 type transport system ATP-binding protein